MMFPKLLDRSNPPFGYTDRLAKPGYIVCQGKERFVGNEMGGSGDKIEMIVVRQTHGSAHASA